MFEAASKYFVDFFLITSKLNDQKTSREIAGSQELLWLLVLPNFIQGKNVKILSLSEIL